jgi:amidase
MAAVNEDLAFAGAARQAELIRSGEVSSVELTEMYLERIERIDPQLNAYRDVFAGSARREAQEADERRRAGAQAPLLGVPIAIKDTLDVAGDVTMFGTAGFDQPASEDGELVRRLREAGAVILGKTNLPELAIFGFTESKTFGATRNPWNTERTTGGSSGGAGAATAAGLCALAHGSDGAGSIRIPAACCGVFGMKPQLNRVPMASAGGHWFDLSVNGCLSRTVMDTALYLDVVTAGGSTEQPAPPPPSRPFVEATRTSPGKLRIALSTKGARAAFPPIVTDEVKAAVAETGELLRGLGHEISERDPSFGQIGQNLMNRYLGGIREDVKAVPHPERLESRTRGMARLGLIPSRAAERSRRKAATDWSRLEPLFDQVDVLVTPTIGSLPVEVGHWEGKRALRIVLGMSRRYAFTPIWNHLGNPCASVPAGWDKATGLPLAVLLVGRPNDEETLISLAAQIEHERPWADRRPDLT